MLRKRASHPGLDLLYCGLRLTTKETAMSKEERDRMIAWLVDWEAIDVEDFTRGAAPATGYAERLAEMSDDELLEEWRRERLRTANALLRVFDLLSPPG
jgi:hypothetical protein